MRTALTFLLFAASLFADPRFLPLQEGNFWTYRQRGGFNDFTIQVGAPSVLGEKTYYRLVGYTTRAALVRFGENGDLYYYDQVGGRDVLLTSFDRTAKDWEAPLRICQQQGQVQEERGKHSGPAGPIPSTLVIRYMISDCADVGTTDEQYAENIGMVERTITTFAGPRTFDLVAARIGSSTIQTSDGGTFAVSLEKLSASQALLATLEIKVNGPQPVNLHYWSSQEYDVLIRSAAGNVVWFWSADKTFLAALHDETTYGRSWSVRVPLTDGAGAKLPPGKYQLEAWITSGYDRPQYGAVATFEIPQTN